MYHTHTRSECCITRSRTLVDVSGLGTLAYIYHYIMHQASHMAASRTLGRFSTKHLMSTLFRPVHIESVIDYPMARRSLSMLMVLELPVCRFIITRLREHRDGLNVRQLMAYASIDIPRRQKQAVISQHLTMLRKYGLVTYHASGRQHIYTLCDKRLTRIATALYNFSNSK